MDPGPVRIEELLAHAGWVRRLAAHLVADAGMADDVAQEVWAYALRSPPRDRRNLRAWLAAVVHNAARSLGRAERRRAEREAAVAPPERDVADHDLVERGELHRRLVEEVMTLEEPLRSIVLAHWFDGQSVAAVARRQGLTPRVVHARLGAAHEELRRRLDRSAGGRGVWCLAFARTLITEGDPALRATSGVPFAVGGVLLNSKLWISAAALAALAAATFVAVNVLPHPGSERSTAADLPSLPRAEGSPSSGEMVASTPSSRSAQSASVRVVVNDECAHPLAGATIVRRDGRAEQILATTDVNGVATIPNEPGGDALEVRHPLFRSAQVPGGSDSSDRLVVLEALQVITGTVTSRVPGFRPESVTVYAIESSSAEWAIEGARLKTCAGSARPGADGRFRIPCVRASVGFSILAGGEGWTSIKRDADPWPFVRAGDECTLEMKRLLAAILDIRDQFGEPAHLASNELDCDYSVPLQVLPGGLVENLVAESIAAGAQENWLHLPEGQLLRLFFADEAGEGQVASTLQLEAPGYAPARIEYLATSCAHPIQPQSVSIQRSVESFGSIRIRFLRQGSLASEAAEYPTGTLRLKSESGAALEYRIRPHHAETFVQGVPVGAYRASYLPLWGGHPIPDPVDRTPITNVLRDRAVEFAVPLDEFASVRIEFTTRDGAEFTGPFTYSLEPVGPGDTSGTWKSTGRSVTGTQLRAPFGFRGIQSGTYVLHPLVPRASYDRNAPIPGAVLLKLHNGEARTLQIPIQTP